VYRYTSTLHSMFCFSDIVSVYSIVWCLVSVPVNRYTRTEPQGGQDRCFLLLGTVTITVQIKQ